MARYMVSYDLHNARQYEPVYKVLNGWGAVRLLESLWLLNSPSSAGTLRQSLQTAIDNDDSVAIIELKPGSEWASRNAKSAGAAWLTANIKAY